MATFAPDVIAQVGPLPITNTLIHTIAVDVVLIAAAIYISKHLSEKPKSFQSVIEPIIDGMYSLTNSIASSKKAASKIFPYIMTFFLFILVANFMGLLPGVGTVGFYKEGASHAKITSPVYAVENLDEDNNVTTSHTEEDEHDKSMEYQNDTAAAHSEKEKEHDSALIPLLRGSTSDINVTLALSLVSVIATHMLSIQLTGIKDYLSRYLSLNPINLYVGLLELVAEFTKIISLSFRLFGNIYAGEVALHTIANLVAFLAPLPFLFLESIVSIVQALVFSILTLVFMAVLTKPHHAHEETAIH